MSIQLKGNNESTFANDVTIGGGITATGASLFFNDLYAAGDLATDGDFYVFKTSVGFSAKIGKDGSAQFAGLVRGGTIQAQGGTNSNGINFRGISGNDETFVVKTDGSATFASGYSGITSEGTIFCNRAQGQNIVFSGATYGGGNTSYITAAGNAVFNGNVSADGNVLTRNVEITLDTGGTLDVKERLQNTQAALTSLKTAAAAASDFATLKAAIASALANI